MNKLSKFRTLGLILFLYQEINKFKKAVLSFKITTSIPISHGHRIDLLFSTFYKGFVLPLEATVSVCVSMVVPVGVTERMRILTGRPPQLPALCLPRAAGTRVTVRLNSEMILYEKYFGFENENFLETTCRFVVVGVMFQQPTNAKCDGLADRHAQLCAKVMCSVVSVCLFSHRGGGPYVTTIHDVIGSHRSHGDPLGPIQICSLGISLSVHLVGSGRLAFD